MKIVLIAIVSLITGAAGSWFVLAGRVDSCGVDDLSKKLLVESGIDTLDYIHQDDMATAELTLAAAINSQILIERKMKSGLAEEWDQRMSTHNARLGLRTSFKKEPK